MSTQVKFTMENNIIKGVSQPLPTQDRKIGKIFLDSFTSHPEHILLIEAATGRKLTFQQMKDLTIRCAIWLKKQNASKNDVIALSVDHSVVDYYVTFLAAFYVGAVYNPWQHDLTLTMARKFMKLTKPKIMFAMASNVDILAEAAASENIETKFVVFGSHAKHDCFEKILSEASPDEINSFDPVTVESLCDPAVFLFTSGSTGFPKAVVLSYQSVLGTFYREDFSAVRNDLKLWYSYPLWVTDVMFFLKAIQNLGTKVHPDKPFDLDGSRKTIEKYKIQWIFLTPSIVDSLHKSNYLNLYPGSYESLRVITSSGEKVQEHTFAGVKSALPRVSLLNLYGATETAGPVITTTSENTVIDSIGFVQPNVQAKVVDENKKALGPNTPGELYVKLPSMMSGYFNNVEETKKVIDEEGWYITGDRVQYKDSGEFIYLERIKNFIKYKGHHVYPAAIESLLMTNPGVEKAVVIPLPHETDGSLPTAFVKKVKDAKTTADELVALSTQLGEYNTLAGGVFFLDDIPHLPSGKVARNELAELAKKLAK